MKTAELAEDIVDYLNSLPPETWSGLTVGNSVDDFIHAENALSPIQAFEAQRRSLNVIPIVAMYERSASQGRQRVVKLNKAPAVVIALTVPLTELHETGEDVATWDQIKKIINLREEIDEAIATATWPLSIKNITAEPAEELPLKQRWYCSYTEFEFESYVCPT